MNFLIIALGSTCSYWNLIFIDSDGASLREIPVPLAAIQRKILLVLPFSEWMNEWIYFISSICWRFWTNISITTRSTEYNYIQVNKTVNYCPLQEFAMLWHRLIKTWGSPLRGNPAVFCPACTQFGRCGMADVSCYLELVTSPLIIRSMERMNECTVCPSFSEYFEQTHHLQHVVYMV